MTYFDCFVLAAWAFAFGSFIGAIYVQNHAAETETPRVSETAEPCPNGEGWRLPVATSSAAAAD